MALVGLGFDTVARNVIYPKYIKIWHDMTVILFYCILVTTLRIQELATIVLALVVAFGNQG